MEGLHDHGVDKSSKNGEESKISEVDPRGQKGGGETAAEVAEKKPNDDVVIDINDESLNSETLCRICQLNDDESSGVSQLITLGCDCRGELGVSHRSCATTWFLQKRNRICEICGKTAKNISYYEVESEILIMQLIERRLVTPAVDTSNQQNSRRRCNLSFCNFLLICLLIALPMQYWFYR